MNHNTGSVFVLSNRVSAVLYKSVGSQPTEFCWDSLYSKGPVMVPLPHWVFINQGIRQEHTRTHLP